MVKISDCLPGLSLQLDIERNVLVKGICFRRIVAHGISRRHIHELFGFIDISGFLTEAIEAILCLDLACMEAAAVRILAIRKIRNIRMQLCSLCIIYTDSERILLNFHAKLAALNNRLILCIGKLRLRRLYSGALLLQKVIRPGLPRRHNKAVGGLIPISVKTGTDTKNIIRQEPQTKLHCIRCDGIIVFSGGHCARLVAYLHIPSPLCCTFAVPNCNRC